MEEIKGHLGRILFLAAALTTAVITLAILGFMVILAWPILSQGQILEMLTSPWSPDQGLFGLAPMVLGSVYIAGFALVLSFPLSLGVSLFTGVLYPKGSGQWLTGMVQAMTAIPTVIYGFIGIFLLVPLVREMAGRGSGMCILSAAIMLAVLICPTMVLLFTQSFSRIPPGELDAVEALGGNTAQKFIHVILPRAWSGMLTGLILSFGRAMGDTLIALMIAGNAVAFPNSVLESARTLTAHIALVIAADFESVEFTTLFMAGICLYAMTCLGVFLSGLVTKRAANEPIVSRRSCRRSSQRSSQQGRRS